MRARPVRSADRALGLAVWLACLAVPWVWLAAPARSAEIDSLTRRDVPLADATGALEHRLNAALRTGVERANGARSVCDERALYRELRRAFSRPFIGHAIAESLNEDASLERVHVLRAESIYRDLGVFDNPSVHWKELSAVVRVGDARIGVDKLGHFVVEGYGYFETAYLDGEGAAAAASWGEWTESTYFGDYTTGVHSYADLVANFEGMRFWRRVLGRGEDPLDAGGGPYVRCGRAFLFFGERRWRLARELALDDYVSPVWDEAVNCCGYRSAEIEAKVLARIDELTASTGEVLACPLDPDACARARERYGEWAPRLLHPRCLEAPAPERPWWRLGR